MRYVLYQGQAHRRVITAADWRSVRLKGDQVVWEAQNGFAVPFDQFSEEQIEQVIKRDNSFTITDEDFQPTYMGTDMTPWEMRQAVENPVDVSAMLDGADFVSRNGSEPSATAAPNGGVSTDQRDEIFEDTAADDSGAEQRQMVDGAHLSDDEYAPDGGNLPDSGTSSR